MLALIMIHVIQNNLWNFKYFGFRKENEILLVTQQLHNQISSILVGFLYQQHQLDEGLRCYFKIKCFKFDFTLENIKSLQSQGRCVRER